VGRENAGLLSLVVRALRLLITAKERGISRNDSRRIQEVKETETDFFRAKSSGQERISQRLADVVGHRLNARGNRALRGYPG
jgi:hypothetical protein